MKMMKFATLIFLLFPLLLQAEDFAPLLTKALLNESLTPEESRELVKIVFRKHDEVLNTLATGLESEAKSKADALLPELQKTPIEDHGKNALGAAVGWFLEYQGTTMTSFPILTQVHDDSIAAKAELRLGDVLWKLEGESLHHAHSRNRFIHLLKIWPVDTPMHFEVRRDKKWKKVSYLLDRRQKVKLTVNFKAD